MLRMLIRPLVCLCAACGLLAGFIPALGQRLPDRASWVEVGFSACDLPCWSNITPGRTPFSQVKVLLAGALPVDSSRLLDSGSQVVFWTSDPEQEFSGYFHYNYGTVGSVNIRIALPAGQLVRRLGSPDCVYVESSGVQDALILYWEADGISTGAMFPMDAQRSWTPETLTTSLWMSATSLACHQRRGVAWIGFAPFFRYQDLLP